MKQFLIEGAYNFRDLGGLGRADGRAVRSRILFRSDTLQALTAADCATLVRELGLKLIVDLRREDEIEGEGRGLLARHGEIRYCNAPLGMASGDDTPPGEVMSLFYLSCLAPASLLPRAIEEIAAMAGMPTIFHCAAGKDRTGIVAAMLLRLIGVDDEVIVADYMQTARAMPGMLERFASWPRYRDHMAIMPPEVYRVEEGPIRQFLAQLDARYGGARQWALQRGIDARLLTRLEANLLD